MKASSKQIELVEMFGSEIEDGGKWALICSLHSEMIQGTSKRNILSFKAHSDQWCMGCQDDDHFDYTCGYIMPDYYFEADGKLSLDIAPRHIGCQIGSKAGA